MSERIKPALKIRNEGGVIFVAVPATSADMAQVLINEARGRQVAGTLSEKRAMKMPKPPKNILSIQ